MFSRSRNHTALAFAPQDDQLHPSVSPALARAFDGFFGPPARELQSSASRGSRPASSSAVNNRASVDTLPPYEPREAQSPLPVYTVVGRY